LRVSTPQSSSWASVATRSSLLRRRVDAAALDRAHTHPAAERLVELVGGRPADVLAPRALAAVDTPTRTRLQDPLLTAPKAFDSHALGIGGKRQSVEYFGWTFSPRIWAIALLAAIAASPMPIVISVILPG